MTAASKPTHRSGVPSKVWTYAVPGRLGASSGRVRSPTPTFARPRPREEAGDPRRTSLPSVGKPVGGAPSDDRSHRKRHRVPSALAHGQPAVVDDAIDAQTRPDLPDPVDETDRGHRLLQVDRGAPGDVTVLDSQ